MTCEECQNLLLDYLYGELDASRRSAVEAALKACPDCAAELAAMQQVQQAYGHLEDPEVPVRLHQNILREARVHADVLKASAQPWYAGWLMPSLSLVGSMAILLIGFRFLFPPTGTGAPGSDEMATAPTGGLAMSERPAAEAATGETTAVGQVPDDEVEDLPVAAAPAAAAPAAAPPTDPGVAAQMAEATPVLEEQGALPSDLRDPGREMSNAMGAAPTEPQGEGYAGVGRADNQPSEAPRREAGTAPAQEALPVRDQAPVGRGGGGMTAGNVAADPVTAATPFEDRNRAVNNDSDFGVADGVGRGGALEDQLQTGFEGVGAMGTGTASAPEVAADEEAEAEAVVARAERTEERAATGYAPAAPAAPAAPPQASRPAAAPGYGSPAPAAAPAPAPPPLAPVAMPTPAPMPPTVTGGAGMPAAEPAPAAPAAAAAESTTSRSAQGDAMLAESDTTPSLFDLDAVAQTTSDQMLAQGIAAAQAGDWATAQSLLEPVTVAAPSAEASYWLLCSLLALDQYDRAVTIMAEMRRLYPGHPRTAEAETLMQPSQAPLRQRAAPARPASERGF